MKEVLIEWPKGEFERWRHENGELVFHRREPWAALFNYGCLPGTHNSADGDEIDAIVLGPPLPLSDLRPRTLVGMVWLNCGDHKLVFSEEEPSDEEKAAVLGWFESDRNPVWKKAEFAAEWLRAQSQSESPA